MISVIQSNRSQHMEHVVERNEEPPFFDFFFLFRQGDKSLILSGFSMAQEGSG